MDKRKLNKLKKGLGRNMTTVANELNISLPTVSRVLNGDFENEDVINKCIEVRNRIAEKRKQLMEQI